MAEKGAEKGPERDESRKRPEAGRPEDTGREPAEALGASLRKRASGEPAEIARRRERARLLRRLNRSRSFK